MVQLTRIRTAWLAGSRDLRVLGEISAVTIAAWLVLGWWFGEPVMREDGPQLWAPYMRSALEAGPDWREHLYRVGVLGGSPMHGALNTSLVLQLCALLGVPPTATGNVSAFVLQICVAYFAIVLIEALVTAWSGERRRLDLVERLVTVVLTAFGPAVAWRIASGHQNVMQGVLPWVALVSLWWSARAGTLSWVTVLVGCYAIFDGLASIGQQSLVYSAMFGAPLLLATIFGGPREVPRFGRKHVAVMLAASAAALLASPRVIDMIHHQLGPDASRGASVSMFYSFGHPFIHDWLTSLPWTIGPALHWPGVVPPHETNYPIGPLIVVAFGLWPRGHSRELVLSWAVGAVLAIAFTLDVDPIATWLRELPLVDAFRVPSRSMVPLVVILPSIALAALWGRTRLALSTREKAVGIAIVIAAFWLARATPTVLRELVAWASCAALVVSLRSCGVASSRILASAIGVVTALGLSTFDERINTSLTAERIEDAPQQLRASAIARAPELALPFVRVAAPGRLKPIGKSFAYAAGLSTLDGVFFPTSRYHALVGAVQRSPLARAVIDFDVTAGPGFDVLTQLYNVRYVVEPDDRMRSLPRTNGPAWFVADVAVIDNATEMIDGLRAPGPDLRERLATTAWVLRGDAANGLARGPRCAEARVGRVTTDDVGQSIQLDVETPETCVLVVTTNHSSLLRATSRGTPLVVVPVNVALLGIVVPAGTRRIEIAPVPYIPWWASLGWYVGLVALAAACLVAHRNIVATGTG